MMRTAGLLLWTLLSAAAAANTPLDPLPASFEAALPGASGPRLALSGMFIVQADAARITLCADGRRLPVAMEADYRALEAAYLPARGQPGQALLVSLDGLIALRPHAEAARPLVSMLVPERFIGVWPRESCGQPLADSPLLETYWKLVRLDGVPVQAADAQREAHLVFRSQAARLSGSGGCNRIVGRYEISAGLLRIEHAAATQKACPQGMAQEQRFLDALGRVRRHAIRGSHLELLDADGAVLARLEAVALR